MVVGIDWATQSHRACLLDIEGRHVNERDFAHSGAGLTELRDWLLEKTKAAPGQIAVAIETSSGPPTGPMLLRSMSCRILASAEPAAARRAALLAASSGNVRYFVLRDFREG
jgi:hypothetical protein